MIPSLPATQVRAAIAAEDWTHAGELLARHQQAIATALAATDLSREPVAPWQALLAEQRALQEEVRDARDRVGAALQKLGQDLRGARAWMRELA